MSTGATRLTKNAVAKATPIRPRTNVGSHFAAALRFREAVASPASGPRRMASPASGEPPPVGRRKGRRMSELVAGSPGRGSGGPDHTIAPARVDPPIGPSRPPAPRDHPLPATSPAPRPRRDPATTPVTMHVDAQLGDIDVSDGNPPDRRAGRAERRRPDEEMWRRHEWALEVRLRRGSKMAQADWRHRRQRRHDTTGARHGATGALRCLLNHLPGPGDILGRVTMLAPDSGACLSGLESRPQAHHRRCGRVDACPAGRPRPPRRPSRIRRHPPRSLGSARRRQPLGHAVQRVGIPASVVGRLRWERPRPDADRLRGVRSRGAGGLPDG